MGQDDDKDPQIFQALKHLAEVRRLLLRFTRKEQDLEELMQETYTRFLQAKRKPFVNIQSVGAFLHTIARNTGLDWVKKQKAAESNVSLEDEALNTPDGTADPQRSAEALERWEKLQAVITRFPSQQKRVFELHRWDGKSRQEIAALLGITENTVNAHLVRAASQLAAALHGS